MPQTPELLGVQDHLDLETPEDRWLVKGLWEAEGSILFGGHTGTGKSQLAMSMAFDLALGRPLYGNPLWVPSKRNRVLYVDQENGKWLAKDRLENRLMADPQEPIPPKDYLSLVHRAYGYPLDTRAGRQWMTELCDSFAPDVVILDSLKDSMDGDPSDNAAATKFYHNLWEIRDKVKVSGSMGLTWVLVHHVNKTSRDKATNDDYNARGPDLFRGARTWIDGATGGFLSWKLGEAMTQEGEWFRQRMYFIKVRATEEQKPVEMKVMPGGKVQIAEALVRRPPGL